MSEGIAKIGVQEISRILPHRYPFSFVDKILDLIPGKSGTGIKEVAYNEHISPMFLIEAMAQVAGIILAYNNIKPPSYPMHPSMLREELKADGVYAGYLIEVRDILFLDNFYAGDRLILNLNLIQKFGNLFRFDGKANVEDRLIAKGEVSIAIVTKSPHPPDNPPLPPFSKGGMGGFKDGGVRGD